jgi:hypothetical protein
VNLNSLSIVAKKATPQVEEPSSCCALVPAKEQPPIFVRDITQMTLKAMAEAKPEQKEEEFDDDTEDDLLEQAHDLIERVKWLIKAEGVYLEKDCPANVVCEHLNVIDRIEDWLQEYEGVE